ncbi:Ca-activated chloride channel family protein [Desulfatibacillum alkenivorans DSM 16219]|uniref:Ca-activated chloride channel family protein n=1 Tax=Desulfatibacillum alkenivorans DSM 16219 TaxID=1121393 RepID=A0A1M6VJM5_9BACT|nr:VWA domain-containing protein [Desulfatibacillum alkenivorans]SHK81658.1 Ca-activated chloride channel family protein [Desulfatibacillum alkenivorans DSM 16219]
MKAKALLLVGVLIAATFAAMAYANRGAGVVAPPPVAPATPPVAVNPVKNGIVALTGKLTQDKIHATGDRMFDLVLTMTADEVLAPEQTKTKPVDMVIVLDRSGSMGGQKIRDAKTAVKGLVEGLRSQDRFSLVTYSNDVDGGDGLHYLTADKRNSLNWMVDSIPAGGGTNLGGGLEKGVSVLRAYGAPDRMGKVILISDGQANQGVTDPNQLAAMAALGDDGLVYSVTTVGLGQDFNEQLMATVADGGRGRYYYLENPGDFLAVFQEEANWTRAVAASALSIHLPLPKGVTAVSANGYPVINRENGAFISPGALLSGQSRTLYIRLHANEDAGEILNLDGVKATYVHEGQTLTAMCPQSFEVQVTQNAMAALESVSREAWEEKVLSADWNVLKEEVAADIKAGDKDQAKHRIQEYRQSIQVQNSVVNSPSVESNLNEDCEALMDKVDETFTGNSSEVMQKQRAVSKSMQYEGYKDRRGIK